MSVSPWETEGSPRLNGLLPEWFFGEAEPGSGRIDMHPPTVEV